VILTQGLTLARQSLLPLEPLLLPEVLPLEDRSAKKNLWAYFKTSTENYTKGNNNKPCRTQCTKYFILHYFINLHNNPLR
jgi:hypothetical protein